MRPAAIYSSTLEDSAYIVAGHRAFAILEAVFPDG